MRCAVWFSQLGGSHNPKFEFPYSARSPVTGDFKKFQDLEDVSDEIEKVINQKGEKKFVAGQTLYYELPFFANPNTVISDWCFEMIQDYILTTRYNIPFAKDLDSVNVFHLDCFNIIEAEINNINKHKEKKNADK